jgi:hypothetical protein
MANKKLSYAHPEILELYLKLLEAFRDMEKKGAANPYTSLNGHMYSFLDKAGLMSLRLGKADQEAFVKKYKTGPSIQYGREMKDYVMIPPELLKQPAKLKPYFQASYDYIQTLKPKSTKKK